SAYISSWCTGPTTANRIAQPIPAAIAIVRSASTLERASYRVAPVTAIGPDRSALILSSPTRPHHTSPTQAAIATFQRCDRSSLPGLGPLIKPVGPPGQGRLVAGQCPQFHGIKSPRRFAVAAPCGTVRAMRDKLLGYGARLAFGLAIFAVLVTAILLRPPKWLGDFDQSFYLSIAYDLDHHGVFSNGVFDQAD